MEKIKGCHHNVNVNLNANWPDGMWLMVWDYEGKELDNVNVNLNAN